MIHCLDLKGMPIFEQLQIEEALLRADDRNWCLINYGSSAAIVMGISGKVEELIDLNKIASLPLPIIRRFSGGGTVVVDEETLFVTFIFQKDFHPFAPYPEPILQWTESIYQSFLPIKAKENDYTIEDKKCGGNAQYLKRDRWLHHTSFLWNFQNEKMDYLLFPKKTPLYRRHRSHGEFLCKLHPYFSSKEELVGKLKETLFARYAIREVAPAEILPLLNRPHRKATSSIHLHPID